MNILLALLGLVLVLAGAAFLRRLDERAYRLAEERDAQERRMVLDAAQRRLGEQMRVHGQSLLTNRRYRMAHEHLAPQKRTAPASVFSLNSRKK